MSDEDDEEEDLGDLADLWDTFSKRWEQEFQRLSEAEDVQLRQVTEEVHRLAINKALSFGAAVGAVVAESDAAAHHISQVAGEVVQAERLHAVRQVREDAAQSRCSAAHTAMRETEDIAGCVMEGASQRRREMEARRREAKRAREAEMEARRRQRAEADAASASPGSTPGAGAAGPGPGPGPGPRSRFGDGTEPQPPRFTRVPGDHKSGLPEPAAPKPPMTFATFQAFDAAWLAFEEGLGAKGGAAEPSLCCGDIPWPAGLPTVSGVSAGDPPKERKRKFRAAVLRWHPDKWAPVLSRVLAEDRAAVIEKVQEVTRKILDERKRFG